MGDSVAPAIYHPCVACDGTGKTLGSNPPYDCFICRGSGKTLTEFGEDLRDFFRELLEDFHVARTWELR